MTLNRKTNHVIIIGANFAGLSAASKLSKCHQVTVVDSRQDFQWTPNIHEILSDVKKDTSLSLPLATIISRLGHNFIQQTVVSIDARTQTVTLDDEQTLSYDALLIASGHTRSNYDITGANSFAYGFRTAQDVVQIHHHIEAVLNTNKKRVNINIIGGGFTGVEVLGELLRKYAHNQRLHFNVIDSAARLVQALPEKLSEDILSQCKSYNVEFYFKQRLTEVKESSIHFADDKSIHSDLTIWSAGTKLPEYLQNINTQINSTGIAVNTYLQSNEWNNIFVAGDSASLSKPIAKQASIAMDMGLHAALNINRFCAKKTLLPFRLHTKPILLSLGDINTYFIQGNLVLSSPLLAAAKEAVYQFYMARLSALLPLEQSVLGIAGRFSLSTEKLLLAEVLKLRPRVLLGRSKLL